MKINFATMYTFIWSMSGSLAGPNLPITFPFPTASTPTVRIPQPTAPPPTVDSPQVIGTGSLVGAVVGACIGTALLHTVILLVWVLWNKRHR